MTSPTAASEPELAFTGERMVPEGADPTTFWEHIYRYRFAARYARGRQVLDIACGEGYGSAALLAAGAASVTGVDISPECVAHARARYGIDARAGSAEAIPAKDNAFDLIVSFETIEHVPHPDRFLDECRRVCRPGGTILISTPNKGVYLAGLPGNPFHCSELSRDEFLDKLSARFRALHLFVQRPTTAPWWSPRWLCAERPPILRLRGVTRLRAALTRRLCPQLTSEPGETLRRSAVKVTLSHDPPLSRLVNPFLVRKPASLCDERPLYFLAEAQR